MSLVRYDLTQDCTTGEFDITPVPETMAGRYVAYQDYAELEAKCAALAAENAGLKALARGWANATDDQLFEEHGEIFHDSIEACEEELKTICPATDAFLAEVRAQGVEMFAEMYACEAIKDGDVEGWKSNVSNAASEYAAQLRKGDA